MREVKRVRRAGRVGDLLGALFWRTRQEGLRNLLAAFAPFLLAAGAILALSLISRHTINGAAAFATFAHQYGAQADAVSVGLSLLIVPGLVAIFTSAAVVALVRNLVGSEATRGGIETLMSGPYLPRHIMTALLLYVGAISTAYWLGMMAISAVLVAATAWTSGARLALGAAYLSLTLGLPLLCAWAASGLALLLALLYPRLARAGSFGLNPGAQGIGSLPAMLPGIGVMLTFTLGATHVPLGELFAIAGGVTAAITAGSVATVSLRFHPEAVLDAG